MELADCKGEFIHDIFLRSLPKDGVIIDAGCGVARWPIYLRQHGYRVYGIEWSHDACLIGKENDPGLEVVLGDVRHTHADISRARDVLGYEPTVGLREGLERTVEWFRSGRRKGVV